MGRIVFVIVFFIGTWCTAQVKIPASTLLAMEKIQNDLRVHPLKPSKSNLDFYPIYKYLNGYKISVLTKINSSFDRSVAALSNIEVGAVIRHIASLQIPLHLFHSGFNFPGIEYMELAEKVEPFLNAAIEDTRADSVHMGYNLPQSYTGKNVLIGIVDWGFDYTHPVFYDTTLSTNRILAAWDQVKVLGTPPAGFSHGSAYTTTAQLLAAESDTFSIVSDYHGTHVAGIAGGSGGGTIYRGIGFEGDLLFSQMRSDASSSLDAFEWMYGISQAEGKRLVINNSWGSYRNNPLDGTSLVSQAIDAYSDSGVVFVFSAGNNGGVNFHLKKDFAHDSVKTRIMGFGYGSDTSLWGQTITMWGEVGKQFSLQLRTLNNVNVFLNQSDLYSTQNGPFYIDTFYVTGVDTIWYNLSADSAHPLNSRPTMSLNVKCTNTALKSILYAQADTGTVHFWNSRLTISGGGNTGAAFATNGSGYVSGDKNYGCGHAGITSSAITVAAHQTNAGITSFSSYGPRMDEVQKPDVSAPGQNIASALSSFASGTFTPVTSVVFGAKTYEFIRASGTSMSGPMVAGVVSLILEADPTLTPQEVKDIVKNTARTDSFTGAIPVGGSVRWGMGKVNAYAAVMSTMPVTVNEISVNSSIKIYPNPANDYLTIEDLENDNYELRIFSTSGNLLLRENINTSKISIGQLPKGIYLLRLTNSTKSVFFRLIKA